jgi:hypothetical protein
MSFHAGIGKDNMNIGKIRGNSRDTISIVNNFGGRVAVSAQI